MRLRLIHVGLGGWGRDWETNALPQVSTVDRVAVVDSDPAILAKARDEFDLSDRECFTDLATALATVDADAVLITAPLAAHVPLALEALAAGRHVLVEKPFAPTVADAQRAVEAANAAGRVLMVSQNYRFHPAARTAARLVADRHLGLVGTVNVDFRKWANDAPPGSRRHYNLHHPLLYDMAIHHFDLMRMVLGQEPVRVFTQITDPPWSNFVEEAAAVLTITFERGTVVSYRGSWVSTAEPTTWSGAWSLECEDGELFWTGRGDGPAGSIRGDVVRVRRRPRPGTEQAQEELVPMPDLRYVGRAGVLAAFAEAVATGAEPETSGRRNLPSLALAEAAARSAESGRPEPVERFPAG